MGKRTAYSYVTLSVMLFFFSLLLTNALSPLSREHYISSKIAFAQLPPEPIPATTEAATVTPASEIGTTIRPSSIVLMNIEDLRATDKTGDAEVDPNSLKISSTFGDEENGHIIQYTPASLGFAGIAYKADKNYDLSNAQRVVFFAKGQNGGENVTFAAVGRNTNAAGFNNTDETLGSAFNNQNFSLISEDVSLDREWKRYQISLEGVDLQRISHPFAFIVHQGPGPEAVTFTLRDITYDSKPATDPLDVVEQPQNQTTNQTSVPTVPSDSQANNTSASNATQGSFPSIETEGLATNTTDTPPLNTTDTLPLNTNDTLSSVEEINTNSTSDESSGLTNNVTRAASNPGEQEVAVNNSSSLIDSALPIFPNITSTTDFPQSNKIPNTDTVNADLNDVGSNSWSDNSQRPNAPNNARSSAPSLISSQPLNLSASNLTIAQPVDSGIANTDIQTNSSENIPQGSSSFLQLSPLSDPTLPLLPSEAFSPTFSDTNPPDTVIPLVTDSNTGSAIQNGGITDSESPLSFTFDGLDETSNSIAGYQCSLDGSTGYYCTSPITLDNNYLGTGGVTPGTTPNNIHSFQVSAVDAAGNVDPTPAEFGWSVPGGANIQDTSAQDTIAPDTMIVSVVDSNNATIVNGSSVSLAPSSLQSPIALQFANQSSTANTNTNTFTISFAATDNTNLIEGYQCANYWSSSIPEQIEFTSCTNPSVLELPAESSTTASETGFNNTNIFQVRAVDASDNVDPSPATFLLNIIPGSGLEGAGITEAQQQPQQFQQDPLLQQQQDPLLQQQDPLLQQQQDPLLQQQQDPLLQQQDPLLQQQQDPLLQQQSQQFQQDPLLQQQLQPQPGITVQGQFPETGQFGLIPQQQTLPQVTEGQTQHESNGHNTLPAPILTTNTQGTPSLPTGTTVYGGSYNGIFGADQNGN